MAKTWPSRLGVKNTPISSLQRGNPANECPGYDTKQCDGEATVMHKVLGNAEYSFTAIAPRSTLARNDSTR